MSVAVNPSFGFARRLLAFVGFCAIYAGIALSLYVLLFNHLPAVFTNAPSSSSSYISLAFARMAGLPPGGQLILVILLAPLIMPLLLFISTVATAFNPLNIARAHFMITVAVVGMFSALLPLILFFSGMFTLVVCAGILLGGLLQLAGVFALRGAYRV